VRYLLDTDHLSILQRQAGQDYSNLSTRMTHYPLSDFAISTVTFHEQMLGIHAYINRAHSVNDVVKAAIPNSKIRRSWGLETLANQPA
jgi:tRNA(fMet)-specific endonuclease VapC